VAQEGKAYRKKKATEYKALYPLSIADAWLAACAAEQCPTRVASGSAMAATQGNAVLIDSDQEKIMPNRPAAHVQLAPRATETISFG